MISNRFRFVYYLRSSFQGTKEQSRSRDQRQCRQHWPHLGPSILRWRYCLPRRHCSRPVITIGIFSSQNVKIHNRLFWKDPQSEIQKKHTTSKISRCPRRKRHSDVFFFARVSSVSERYDSRNTCAPTTRARTNQCGMELGTLVQVHAITCNASHRQLPPISAVDLLAASTKMVVTRCRNATRRLRTMEATTNTNSTAIPQKLNSSKHALGKSAKTYNGGKTLSLDIDSLDHWLVAGESGIVCHGLGHALSSAI